METYGYVRVSCTDQNEERQRISLKAKILSLLPFALSLMFSVKRTSPARLPIPVLTMTGTGGGLHGTAARKNQHLNIWLRKLTSSNQRCFV